MHPYDQVTWERRDVVMTNWRDGSVNFEQHGVEFPDSWSVNAANIVTTKYFRGAVGTPQREWSLKQLVDRVTDVYTATGRRQGYFASDEDAEIFDHELKYALIHQIFAFNSPVWFNVGTASPAQVSACFILAVDDTMDSILDWYREEGLIFKGGSGAGVNLSRIRSSKELLSSGGTASGPVSFMRGADASAGTIKSGGATRRAAKMVVLDVDHPDVAEFVETKAREEEKIRVLRDAGFDMDLGGQDINSVQYQNANNSVRVSDEFMQAVEDDMPFDLLARRTGEIIETIDAKDLFRKMAQAAWECADPGIQYDGMINDWHTYPESGRITASNPCSEYVHLDNSSCNLASINLLKFLRADDTFDAERFGKMSELIITAMDISICFADFPTEKIAETTRAYRQLGIGYANLGALLMATGHAYDSVGGRAIAASITSLMTGAAYKRSAELAKVVGPYDGYERNATPHKRVMRMHADASGKIRSVGRLDREILELANATWQECLALGEANGYRNAQASLLAPTGCLPRYSGHDRPRPDSARRDSATCTATAGRTSTSRCPPTRGRARRPSSSSTARSPPAGSSPRAATRSRARSPTASRSSTRDNWRWEWKRLPTSHPVTYSRCRCARWSASLATVPLPVLGPGVLHRRPARPRPRQRHSRPRRARRLLHGDGSLHAKGIRLCVADTDLDVADASHRARQGALRHRTRRSRRRRAIASSTLQSVRLARWWQAAGFAKRLPETRTTAARAGSRGFRPPSSKPTTRWSTARSCAVSSRPTARSLRAFPASRPPTSRSPPRSAPCC